jgi:FemAB-related protein (PEP-CTERM system-associated)
MIRRLPASEEALDAELGSKLRAQIRRAGRESQEVRIGGAELLDDFYDVFARNMRDLGTPVYGKGFFRAVLAAWPQRSHVVVVRLGNRPAAAAILLGFRDMLEIPWASTVREANPLGLNMLLYRSVLGLAIARGYGYFDFGRSSVGAGTYRFKQQWGAHPLQQYWHYGLRNGAGLPRLNPDNPKYRLMISLWQRLPVVFTRIIGPPIVRSLP